MSKLIDETGNQYGRWKVIRRATKEETAGRKGGVFWVCECQCENHTIGVILGHSLRKGESKSCGCLTSELIKKNPKKPKTNRIGMKNINYQNCTMKIISYNNANDIIVQFDDEYKAKVHSSFKDFMSGSVKNPFFKEVYNVGMIGDKYHAYQDQDVREYKIWHSILERCFNDKVKEKQPAYKDVTVCNEWLLFTNFYDWIHEQDNYEKWRNGERWSVDKDILIKHNKIYSPERCLLVPKEINALFTKRQNYRGIYPIGVYYNKRSGKYIAQCSDPYLKDRGYIGRFNSPEEAFYAYKNTKENLIKKIATTEYQNQNITKECYTAMMNYVVEIDD